MTRISCGRCHRRAERRADRPYYTDFGLSGVPAGTGVELRTRTAVSSCGWCQPDAPLVELTIGADDRDDLDPCTQLHAWRAVSRDADRVSASTGHRGPAGDRATPAEQARGGHPVKSPGLSGSTGRPRVPADPAARQLGHVVVGRRHCTKSGSSWTASGSSCPPDRRRRRVHALLDRPPHVLAGRPVSFAHTSGS